MNAERLLEVYEQISEAPDAIARLRRFVLDLAVRGKLVEQDSGDEPASELLKRIANEKARLAKAGQIKPAKQISMPDQANMSVPSGWQVVPLGEVINSHLGGGTPSKNNQAYWGGSIRWASVKDVGKTKYLDETIDRISEEGLANSSSNMIPAGNLIVVTRMGLGQLSINRVAVAINQDLRALFLSPFLDIDFVYNFFLTYGMEGTGLTVKGIKLNELLGIPFPLPPLAEQHRIVAKVDELMALCDRLEEARKMREEVRDKLTAASLARLTATSAETANETTSSEASEEDDFASHARFALETLPALTTRPDQIKSLRQTILNLAVRGKLVEQDPDDEPADELLKAIASEKALLVDKGVIKVDKKPKKAPAQVKLFELPVGWAWANLQSICLTVTDGDHQPPPRADQGVPFLVIGDVRTKTINYDVERKVSYDYFNGLDPIRKPQLGDLLYTLVGSFGIPVPVSQDIAFCVQRHIGILKPSKRVDQKALALFLESEFAFKQAEAAATGIAQKTVSLAGLRGMLLPVPPLAEQHRIVAKVEELMALCDRLEAALTNTDTIRTRLLEALLHEALQPAEDELEAAE